MSNSLKIAILVVSAAGMLIYFMLPDRGDLVRVSSLNNGGTAGNVVSGNLLTMGKSGEVYFWVEQDGKIMCPKKAFVQTNIEHPFSFTCRAMTANDRFTVLTDRNPSDWIKKHAISLQRRS